MSNRMLRKLHGEKDLTAIDVLSESDDNSAAELNTGTRKKINKPSNLLDLLNSIEHSLSDTEAKEDDDKDAGSSKEHPKSKLEKQESTDSLKRKKKKRRKKLKSQKSLEDTLDHHVPTDEVEASVQEVNKILGKPPPSVHHDSSLQQPEKGLLGIEHRHLNPANEMKKIFGVKVVQNEQSKKRGRGRIHGRSTVLVTPKNWPQVGKPGISMNLLEKKGDIPYFAFVHSKEYQRVQYEFLDAVESYNPDNIVHLLNAHPYHVDALLQFSDICKMGDDLQVAADLIERALYCCECCAHPLLNFSQGLSRLDYRRVENRSFFIAIFKHLNFVGQRGCNRTALEFCKLLLGLDPEEDPLCIILLIDFYALRSEQYAFLVRMYREWESERNLSQLPNFAFSVPLALFLQARADGTSSGQADSMLQSGLIMFPALLIPLLDKCTVQPDSRVSSHSFFSTAQTQATPGLMQLIMLYVGRCHMLWKQKDVLTWLEVNVKRVLDRVDAGDAYVAECQEKCKIRYRGTPRNILRHIVLSEIKDALVTLPAEVTSAAIFGYDPLPPTDSIGDYARPPREVVSQQQGMLRTFFRSLLPNFDGTNPERAVGGEAAGEQAPRLNGDLRRSVASLIDAMHDLLSNIHLADVPNDGDVDSDEVDEVED